MLAPTVIMGVIAAALLFFGYRKGGGEYLTGLKSAGWLLLSIIPLLLFAFTVAGMVQILIPTEIISRWVGLESGFRGVLLGSVAGFIAPVGGPYVIMPIAIGLLHAGASIGTTVAFITAWSLIALQRIPMEMGFIGWKFTIIRLACVLLFPVIAGLAANQFFAHIQLF